MKLKNLTAAILLAGLSPFSVQAVTLAINADSHIASANAGMAIGISISPTSKGLLKFDLAALPESITGKDIAKATLVFFAKTVATGGKIQASPVLDAWDEATITTALAPKIGAPIDKRAIINRGNTYVALDVTELVLDWVDNPISNNGLALAPLASSTTTFTLDSKEAIQTSHAAFIDITLIGPAGAKGDKGDTGPQGNTGSPGPVTLIYRRDNFFLSGRSFTERTLTCPTDTFAISGGCGSSDSNSGSGITVNYSGPTPTDPKSGWTCRATNNSLSAFISNFVICSSATNVVGP